MQSRNNPFLTVDVQRDGGINRWIIVNELISYKWDRTVQAFKIKMLKKLL